MIILNLLLLIWVMAGIPVGIGLLCSSKGKWQTNLFFEAIIRGYLVFFALFQVLAVVAVLLQDKLYYGQLIKGRSIKSFDVLCVVTVILGTVLSVAGIARFVISIIRNGEHVRITPMDKGVKALWAVVCGLVLVQMVLAAILQFSDGDDSYYVAVAQYANRTGLMYYVVPYTGYFSTLDIRHVFAPMPILIAYFARISGIHVAVVAHVAMPVWMLFLVVLIYALMGNKLFPGRKHSLPMFLIVAEILILFGNYSPYTQETFLMVRSWQGKAIMANFVIPVAFFLMLGIGEKLRENYEVSPMQYGMLFCMNMTACMCSTMGAFLLAMLLGIFGICAGIVYRKWKVIPLLIVTVIPNIAFAGMYYFMR